MSNINENNLNLKLLSSDPILANNEIGKNIILNSCDKELIHLIPRIQDCGYVYVFSQNACKTDKLLYVSENSKELLNLSLNEIFEEQILNRILGNIDNELIFNDSYKNMKAQFTIDKRKQIIIVTVELFNDIPDMINSFNRVLKKINLTNSSNNLLKEAANQLRKITNYDRVMVYIFDDAYNGEVIYECKDESITSSYLGLHFPSTDIPVQARLLYLTNRVRVINNISKETITIIGKETEKKVNIDLTNCPIRASSLMHIEYMQNMGIEGSMSISIISKQSKLMGLIVLHDYSGRIINPCIREFCKIISTIVSYNIDNYEQNKIIKKILDLEDIIKVITRTLKIEKSLSKDVFENTKKIFEADIMIQVYNDQIYQCSNNKYKLNLIEKLIKLIEENQNNKKIFITDSLIKYKIFSEDTEINNISKDIISGIIGIKYINGYIILGRCSKTLNVKWGGNPDIKKDINGVLHPRNSFETYIKQNKYNSKVWDKYEINAINNLSDNLLNNYESLNVISREHNIQYKENIPIIIGFLGHELKVPLNGLVGALNIINELNYEELPLYIDIAKKCAKSMGFIIDDTLSISNLINGKSIKNRKELINLKNIYDDCIFILKSSIDNKNIRIITNTSSNENSLIYGDNQKLRQIITNILSNAIKYSNINTKIELNSDIVCNKDELLKYITALEKQYIYIYPQLNTIIFKDLEENEKYLLCSIKDEGIGIKHHDYDKLFKMFSRIEGVDDKIDGSGLGLKITLMLCETLGGQIFCGSSYNIGSSFIFYVKINEKEKKIKEEINTKNVVVLLDDDIVTRIVISKMISTIDKTITIESASNINEAFEIVKNQYSSILLVFTDLHIDSNSQGGIDLTTKIRTFEKNNNLYDKVDIIAITADSSGTVYKKCLDSGMNHVIFKPVYLENIRDCINNNLYEK